MEETKKKFEMNKVGACLASAVVLLVIVIAFGAILTAHYIKDYKSKYDNVSAANKILAQSNNDLTAQKNAATAENNQLKQLDNIVALLALDVVTECKSYLDAPTIYTDIKIKTLINFYGAEFATKVGVQLALAVNFQLKYHSSIYFVKDNNLKEINMVDYALAATVRTTDVGTLSATDIVAIAKYNGLTNTPLTIVDGKITKINDESLQTLINA
jgi:cell division protein FtsB